MAARRLVATADSLVRGGTLAMEVLDAVLLHRPDACMRVEDHLGDRLERELYVRATPPSGNKVA